MHKCCSVFHTASLMIWSFGVIAAVFAAPPNIKHTMLISGNSLSYVGIVDTTGNLIWKHDENEGENGNGEKNDSWLLPDGNVAYSYKWGIRIVDIRTNKVIWDRRTPQRNGQSGETQSCQPLDGRSDKFLVDECFDDTAFIVEVDTTGKEWRRIGILDQGPGTHGKWRQIRKTKQNTYLVSSMDLHFSDEYDTTGKLIHKFPAGGFVTMRLDNGNTLTGTGGDCRVVEFDKAGTQVWEVNNTNLTISGVVIGFAAEVQRLPNGNTIITNWGGHGGTIGAAVVEISPDRKVVGAIPDAFPANIASVKIIDGWKSTVREYTFNASAGPNGTISPSGAMFVDSAANKTFTITPDNGFGVDSVKVDGENKGAINTYTFDNVHAPHTVAVVFKKTVGTNKRGIENIRNGTPLITVARGGILTLSIPYSGSTLVRVSDCEGRTVVEQMVARSGYCTLGKAFASGIYTVSLMNDQGKKQWSRMVSVVGK